MGRIASAFKRLGKVNEAALIPYVQVGYPTLDITRQLVPVLARQGADLIELGLPADDLLAVGAIERPFDGRVTLADCLSVAAEARRANEIPLLVVSYYDPIRNYGREAFAADSAASGIDGLVVPDLSLSDATELKAICESAGLDLIVVVSPTSTDDQIQRLAQIAGGFIYCVPSGGPTVAPSQWAAELTARVRRFSDLSLVVGSDFQAPEQIAEITQFAEGALVGSAVMESMKDAPEDEVLLAAADCVRTLKEATAKPLIPDP